MAENGPGLFCKERRVNYIIFAGINEMVFWKRQKKIQTLSR